MNIDILNDEVYAAIARNLGYDPGDEEAVPIILEMGQHEAWRRYCVWNGLLGSFHAKLAAAYENIQASGEPR